MCGYCVTCVMCLCDTLVCVWCLGVLCKCVLCVSGCDISAFVCFG